MKQRLAMWDSVQERQHIAHEVFLFGNDLMEFMIFSLVDYVLRIGEKKRVEWAGRAQLVKSSGRWKLQFYQIWL